MLFKDSKMTDKQRKATMKNWLLLKIAYHGNSIQANLYQQGYKDCAGQLENLLTDIKREIRLK